MVVERRATGHTATIIQIEDCIDCLQYIHPEIGYEFEFDHSSGHYAKRSDRLSTTTSVINLGAL